MTHPFLDGFWFTLGGAFALLVVNAVLSHIAERREVKQKEAEEAKEDFGPGPDDTVQ